MKRRKIVLGILVVVGIVAFVGSAQFGYGKEKSGTVPGVKVQPPPKKCEKCACWKIVKMEADKKCYEVPPTCKEDFKFSFTVDLQATPTSSPPCELVIGASYKTCTYESGTLPPFNLTGVSGWVTWDGAKMEVRRISKHHIQLYFPEYYVSCKCDGTSPVTIKLTAVSMSCGRKICRDARTLTVRPCPLVGKCCIAGTYNGTSVDDPKCPVGPESGKFTLILKQTGCGSPVEGDILDPATGAVTSKFKGTVTPGPGKCCTLKGRVKGMPGTDDAACLHDVKATLCKNKLGKWYATDGTYTDLSGKCCSGTFTVEQE